jgi:hypothetical protein
VVNTALAHTPARRAQYAADMVLRARRVRHTCRRGLTAFLALAR